MLHKTPFDHEFCVLGPKICFQGLVERKNVFFFLKKETNQEGLFKVRSSPTVDTLLE